MTTGPSRRIADGDRTEIETPIAAAMLAQNHLRQESIAASNFENGAAPVGAGAGHYLAQQRVIHSTSIGIIGFCMKAVVKFGSLLTGCRADVLTYLLVLVVVLRTAAAAPPVGPEAPLQHREEMPVPQRANDLHKPADLGLELDVRDRMAVHQPP